jgi:hypothetical protein
MFVMNKTNAVCLRAMWGDDSGEWAGHKVTLHPVKDESGLSESGLCIRVKGSPELPGPLKFRARLGRKMVTQTLVPTGKGSPTGGSAPAPAVEVDEDTGEVFGFDEGPPTEPLEPESGADSADGTPYASETETAPESPDDDDDDGEVPGRGALFSADDPNRPATATDKKALSEAIAHVDTAWTKTYRKRFEGRSNSELTHVEIVAFTAAAVQEALA